MRLLLVHHLPHEVAVAALLLANGIKKTRVRRWLRMGRERWALAIGILSRHDRPRVVLLPARPPNFVKFVMSVMLGELRASTEPRRCAGDPRLACQVL